MVCYVWKFYWITINMVIITILKTESDQHVQPIESKIGPRIGQVKTEKTGKIGKKIIIQELG